MQEEHKVEDLEPGQRIRVKDWEYPGVYWGRKDRNTLLVELEGLGKTFEVVEDSYAGTLPSLEEEAERADPYYGREPPPVETFFERRFRTVVLPKYWKPGERLHPVAHFWTRRGTCVRGWHPLTEQFRVINLSTMKTFIVGNKCVQLCERIAGEWWCP
jgi:hypothetical protein